MANEYAQLQKEREKAVAELAKIDAKLEEMKAERQQELLAQLKELGWTPPAGRKGKSGSKREAKVGAPCGVCKFATDPYHDGRLKAHRDQGEEKKPFTPAQLEKLDLKKIPTAES